MKFNYKAPPAAIFLVNLVRESDLPAATEMVQQNKDEGSTIKEKVVSNVR
jgi:hypothetical protein